MPRTPALLTLLMLAMTPAVGAEESDLSKGFENLSNVIAGAQILDFRSAMGTRPELDAEFLDPWGTPYRIDVERHLVAGARSDRKFDEAAWTVKEQFTGLEGDVVVVSCLGRNVTDQAPCYAHGKEDRHGEVEATAPSVHDRAEGRCAAAEHDREGADLGSVQ